MEESPQGGHEGGRLNYRRRGSMSPTPPPLNTSLPALPNSTFFFLRPQSNNSTYYSDEEEQDTGFSDVETVALACFLTLLPLIFGSVSYFVVRRCRVRWRRTVEPSELAKTIEKESSERTKASHALLNDQTPQMKTSESEFSVVPTEDCEDPGNQTSKLAANGSVITMTMKNNHLIVETEERLDEREECGREASGEAPLEEVTVAADSTAIVHVSGPQPEPLQQGANTGLSTSDLSSSSETSTTNRGYRYGNQEEYRGDDDDDLTRLETGEVGTGALPRASLDQGPPPATGTENPGFQPSSPAEPAAS